MKRSFLGRRIPVNPGPVMIPGGEPRKVGGTMPRPRTITERQVEILGSSPGGRGMKRPLAAKQGTTSTTLAPIHAFPVEGVNEVDVRADALANFATSITANQPVAAVINRTKAYVQDDTQEDGQGEQIAEIEGRALPAAAYFIAHLYERFGFGHVTPGQDAGLANNASKLAYYKAMSFIPPEDLIVENVDNAQPYTGVGALSNYAEDDGASGRLVHVDPVANYFLARSLTVNQIGIRKCRAVFIACAADLNSGFTIRRGGALSKTYTTEEINDIEDEIFEQLGNAPNSLTGAASAAPAGHGVRGAPQDPFTGAAVFQFADVFDDDATVSIVVAGAAQLIQVCALTNDGLSSIRSA